jgi:hypothetical protein
MPSLPHYAIIPAARFSWRAGEWRSPQSVVFVRLDAEEVEIDFDREKQLRDQCISGYNDE